MQRLDRSRAFGEITTPWLGDNNELPRAAAYEQDGRLFDAHDVEIVIGKQPKKKAAPPPPPVADEPDEEVEAQAEEPDAEPARPPPAAEVQFSH